MAKYIVDLAKFILNLEIHAGDHTMRETMFDNLHETNQTAK